MRSTFARVCASGFELAGFGGQIFVFDNVLEPPGNVTGLQVEEPCFVVESFGDLQEDRQVLNPEVQPVVGASKVEAKVRRQLAFCVFAPVTLPFSSRWKAPKRERTLSRLPEP